ncbi:Eco57I restriction-modification methylase domain-containing protein [Polaromonas naphthalenivorans]|uniref:site-specific DNA-methyltransferase (adenine-specific) n=1 Tax=Polaromonas naphthalenivorans (strain CJ2) TaxID=365044 RepID=A1VWE6_POLNA|nr:N-6 DNA methylase [Polaromonas naphthalenivorans]ABM39974.1 N-6 DNA methylase [Polaromonas naphthalenivorans CJ2]
MVIPESKIRFNSLVKSLDTIAKDSENGPQRLVEAVLHAWQLQSYPLLAKRVSRQLGELPLKDDVNKFSLWLSQQSFNDAAFWLASAYATWVGEKRRTEQALYFTPPKLADRVIDDLVQRGASLTTVHWHDPACGGAAFLVPTAQRMAQALAGLGLASGEVLKRIERQLSGNDLDKALLSLSRQFLLMALYPHIKAAQRFPDFDLRNEDGLLPPPSKYQAPDVVICNPPYRKLNAAETQRYASKFKDVIRSQPNIYGLFIREALNVVKPGGLIGLLTPTSFLSGASFSKLRSRIVDLSHILQIDMLSDRTSMFIAVEQETVISVLRALPTLTHEAMPTDIHILTPGGTYENVGKHRLCNNGAPWAIPRSTADSALLDCAERSTARLGDFGYSARIGHLVAFRDKRRRFPQKPMDDAPRCVVPILWAGDITKEGLDHGRVQKKNRTDYFIEVSSLGHTSVISLPSVVLQRLTSNDQHHRLIAAPVPRCWQTAHGGFVAENHVVVLQTQPGNRWTPALMAKVLNSAGINRLYRSISGASNVATSELLALPLPPPRELDEALSRTEDIDEAIRIAFGLATPVTLRKKA